MENSKIENVSKTYQQNQDCGDNGLTEVIPSQQNRGEHTNSIDAVCCNPKNEKEFSTASHDHTIKIWDAARFKCKSTLKGHEQGVWSLKYDGSGSKLISCSPDSTVKIWDAKTSRCVDTLKGHTRRCFKAAFDSDGTHAISVGSDKILNYWDLRNSKKPVWFDDSSKSCLMSCDFMANDNQIITTSLGGEISVFSARQQKLIFRHDTLPGIIEEVRKVTIDMEDFKPREIRNFIYCCHTIKNVVDEENTFLVGAQDQNVTKIKMDYENIQITDLFFGHSAGIRSIDLSRDGKRMVSGCEDHSLRVWDYQNCEAQMILAGHKDFVTGGSFINNDTIVSTSWDTTVAIWKI